METQAFLNRTFKVALFLLVSSITFSCGQTKIMNESRKKNGKKVYACKHIGRQKHTVKRISEKEFVNNNYSFSKEENQIVIPKEFYLPKVDTNLDTYDFVIEVQAQQAKNEIVVPKEFYLPKVDTNLDSYEIELTAELNEVEENIASEFDLPLPQPVYFRFDTDLLSHYDIHQIALAVEHIKLGKSVVLEGHTDSHGSRDYNMELSLKRANAIKQMMIDLGGVNEGDISVKYFGEDKEAVANDTEANRQLNRRVEFIVMQ